MFTVRPTQLAMDIIDTYVELSNIASNSLLSILDPETQASVERILNVMPKSSESSGVLTLSSLPKQTPLVAILVQGLGRWLVSNCQYLPDSLKWLYNQRSTLPTLSILLLSENEWKDLQMWIQTEPGSLVACQIDLKICKLEGGE